VVRIGQKARSISKSPYIHRARHCAAGSEAGARSASVQSGARRDGIAGIYGNAGILESAFLPVEARNVAVERAILIVEKVSKR
jgi:hypothetical protein